MKTAFCIFTAPEKHLWIFVTLGSYSGVWPFTAFCSFLQQGTRPPKVVRCESDINGTYMVHACDAINLYDVRQVKVSEAMTRLSCRMYTHGSIYIGSWGSDEVNIATGLVVVHMLQSLLFKIKIND